MLGEIELIVEFDVDLRENRVEMGIEVQREAERELKEGVVVVAQQSRFSDDC